MASAIPSMTDNPDGLHRRYEVTKTNGEPVDPMATYFVLRLDNFGRDGAHVTACRVAARAYAKTILDSGGAHLRPMAADLNILLDNLEQAD